jgi:hypothetical protein
MGETLTSGIYLPGYGVDGEEEKDLFDDGMKALNALITIIQGNMVDISSEQTISGVKTFSNFPVTPALAPVSNYQVANKKYVTDSINAIVIPSYAQIIPSGAKMLFYMSAAPVGWTQDTNINDRVIRVVSGSGGGNGGSWTMSGLSIGGHSLTTDEMIHTHTISSITVLANPDNPGRTAISSISGSNSSAASHNHAVTHDSSWRPSYIDVIVCTKD